MDFGFSRFLEMFEERFGRHATTFLVALIGLALSVYSLKVVIDASTEFYTLFTTTINWELGRIFIAKAGSFVVSMLLAWIILQAIWRFYFIPRMARVQKRADDAYAECKKTAEEAIFVTGNARAELEGLSVDLSKRINDWEIQTIEREDILNALHAEITEKLKEAQILAAEIKKVSGNK
jgi:hypothetical protein